MTGCISIAHLTEKNSFLPVSFGCNTSEEAKRETGAVCKPHALLAAKSHSRTDIITQARFAPGEECLTCFSSRIAGKEQENGHAPVQKGGGHPWTTIQPHPLPPPRSVARCPSLRLLCRVCVLVQQRNGMSRCDRRRRHFVAAPPTTSADWLDLWMPAPWCAELEIARGGGCVCELYETASTRHLPW